MAGDQAQGQRRLVVRVEIRPVHGDDDLSPRHRPRHPAREPVPDHDALVAEQPIDLLDGVLGEARPRAWAKAWPIIATASEALVITPRVAPASGSIRLACTSPAKIALR